MAFRLWPGSTKMKWAAGAVLTVALLIGGLYTGFDTNAFGPDKLCAGWLEASDVQRVLDGPGRLSGSGTDTGCTVKKSGLAVGGDSSLTVQLAAEPAQFPFAMGDWNVSAAQRLFTGRIGGGADRHGGWALLPAACPVPAGVPSDRSDVRAAVLLSVSGGSADEEAMVRLLTAAAESVAARSGCGDSKGAPARLAAPRAFGADFTRLCALPGFSIPEVKGDRGQATRVQVTGDMGTAWTCDLSFADDKQGPYTRFAVVRDPLLGRSLSARGASRLSCPAGGTSGDTFVTVDNNTYHWDPAQRKAAGLLPEAELHDRFARAVARALHCSTASH
ncbi:hypothetical protein ACGFRG_31170 [Streptomyces sp. NPDC048696]|uniref:hypothetical protein n=1 Tax=Streptomyces sp. NPDC048696 TaxID=3365585 RepID=UPI00371E991E